MRAVKPIVLAAAVAGITFTAWAAQWEALPDKAPAPADNPTTADKVELGKMLYFDPRFSLTGTVSCFSLPTVYSKTIPAALRGKRGGDYRLSSPAFLLDLQG